MAERARFELARDANLYPLSRRAPSTAQPSLLVVDRLIIFTITFMLVLHNKHIL
jgi:hypothetical protein